ncbi:MAG: hypothetical protein AABZ08_12555 [Planctomycetota bacterium]|mgnify:CR=1 FL=1
MNDLLPLIIDDRDGKQFRAHAVVLRNWRSVRDFSDVNQTVMENPERLKKAVEGEEMILRPIIRYQKPE